ncbi:putative RNA-binding domain superfamily [Helianthus debilis subsp. tardiflorus]
MFKGGDRRKPIPVDIQRRLTKFYVSNLPDRCSGMDLAKVVRMHANIFDIYIARKRDKLGNRFGFISLLDVKDRGGMEKILSDIRLGDFKLSFNVARFTLEDGEIKNRGPESRKTGMVNGEGGSIAGVKEFNGGSVAEGRSFRDVILGRQSETKEEKVIEINEDFQGSIRGDRKAVITRMKDFKALKKAEGVIRELMAGAGVVQYVGGMYLLVSFNSSEEVENFLALSKENGEMFQTAEEWSGQTLPFERIAWLRIQGIPLHLLDRAVINLIGERFGLVVKGDIHDGGDSYLSYDYIGILVAEGKRIQEEVVLQWKGRRYRVWVTEEVGDWFSDAMAKEKRGETTKVDNRDDQTDEEKMPESPSQVRRSDDSTPVNRNVATDSVSPQIVFPFPDMERPVFTGIEMETMGNQYNFSKNMGENGGRNKESGVEKEDRRQHGNNRKSSNMRGRVRVGLGQPKHISVDSRPSSKKRPRLDIDQSGLDPFGLDVLLGTHQNI